MKSIKKVAILCNSPSSTKIDRVELIQKIKSEGYIPYIGGVDDKIINENYSEYDVNFIPLIASRNNINPFVEIKSIFSVRKQIKKEHIDAVIIYGVKNHSAMSIGCYLGGVKKILCIVNGSGNLFRITGLKGKIVRLMAFPMLKISYKLSNGVCFQNHDDLILFKNKKLISKNKNVFVTGGSGVNLINYPFSKLPKENRFLFLARITPTKGIKEYIEASYIIKEKYPKCIFDIYGNMDSTIENSVDNIVSKAVEDGIINYYGKTNNVAGAMQKCRFFIYPSYYPEGVSRCLLQALSTGRPIITCNTPGCKETVIDGVNGFLVEKQNIDELVDKMEYFINNQKEVEKMGLESRKLAEQKFDVYDINDEIISKLIGKDGE